MMQMIVDLNLDSLSISKSWLEFKVKFLMKERHIHRNLVMYRYQKVNCKSVFANLRGSM